MRIFNKNDKNFILVKIVHLSDNQRSTSSYLCDGPGSRRVWGITRCNWSEWTYRFEWTKDQKRPSVPRS